MPAPVEVEKARILTNRQEADLLAAALARNPSYAKLRITLGGLLLADDRFDETLALLADPATPQDWNAAMLRFQAHISLETPQDDAAAAACAAEAADLATDSPSRAAALADLGKALRRCGRDAEAEQALRAALALEPDQKNAVKRLTALLFARGDAAAVLALSDRLIAAGGSNSRLLAAKALAHARLGQIDAARAVTGLDRFHHVAMLAPPPGWDTIAPFNAALAEAMLAHPALRYDRYGTASSETWRVDEPASGGSPLVAALQAQIASAVDAYIASLPATGHPWLSAMPERRILHSWCVITDGVGFETWHVHQFGWLSGVYYLTVPEVVRDGSDTGGCLGLGIDDALVGDDAAAAYGIDLLRPEPGMLTLFPSHSYHRTWPHRSNERRIAFAFDIRPG